MNDRYYDTAREEALPWLPGKVSRLLDVGCGSGATAAAVRQVRSVAWAGGIEYVDEVAARAEAAFDRVWRGDAAAAPIEAEIPRGSLDLVLCLDVLEHMSDPWTMVRRLSALIAPGGRLILSVPNIRHWKFIWRLAAQGDFAYRDAGLLDRTHLRFFVRWLARASLGRLDEVMAKQWLVVAEKAAEPSAELA
jgi:2-polyprenyl-3-methyl-5-hydroxy-6-metoxy-1,4-benzoquinol methylase